jgi:hypothetical protein
MPSHPELAENGHDRYAQARQKNARFVWRDHFRAMRGELGQLFSLCTVLATGQNDRL